MPRKDGSLTRTESAFIEVYRDIPDRAYAEKTAGLAPGSGYAMLSRPEIQRRIVAEQIARITSDALPLAVSTLLDVMGNTKNPAAARVQAAKVVLDRALPSGPEGTQKEVHEMTPEEIAAAIAALESLAASGAVNVTPAPDPGGVFD